MVDKIIELLTKEGLTAVLLVYLILERIGPSLFNRFFPAYMSERKREKTERFEAQKREFEESKRIENRLFEIAEAVIASNTRLNYTLEHISSYLQGQSVLMREVSLDIARVYAVMRIERAREEKLPVDPLAKDKEGSHSGATK